MRSYARTYRLAIALAWSQLRRFNISAVDRFRYATKSGNLALCFLGFSIHPGREFSQRSAELGVLASIFDLASDGLKFDTGALHQFRLVVSETVDEGVACIIFNLMTRKQRMELGVGGLDRGVDAVRIVIKHLHAEEVWKSEREIYDIGILCQIIDDVLDYKGDFARQELNFLRTDERTIYLERFLKWDYKEQFKNSRYPFVLFQVIKVAKTRAGKLISRRLYAQALHSLKRDQNAELRSLERGYSVGGGRKARF
jgi:hypothetical protein